jgi:hypothetical protein
VTEPSRLWRRYLIGNVLFVTAVMRDHGGTSRRRVAPAPDSGSP